MESMLTIIRSFPLNFILFGAFVFCCVNYRLWEIFVDTSTIFPKSTIPHCFSNNPEAEPPVDIPLLQERLFEIVENPASQTNNFKALMALDRLSRLVANAEEVLPRLEVISKEHPEEVIREQAVETIKKVNQSVERTHEP